MHLFINLWIFLLPIIGINIGPKNPVMFELFQYVKNILK